MALRGIQEYIARDVNNIARVEDSPTLVTVATSHKLSLSCDDKMAAGSHPRSLDSKMTHKALYE